MGIDLLLQQSEFLPDHTKSIGASDEPTGQLRLVDQSDQRLREFGRVADLLTVRGFPARYLLGATFAVVANGRRSILSGFVRQ